MTTPEKGCGYFAEGGCLFVVVALAVVLAAAMLLRACLG
jgi:hypothetical protein